MRETHPRLGFTLIELPAMRKGFTLIELLVVITIIVILLALLAPALDKAVYQAQLAACGAMVKPLGGAVTIYAFDFRRQYPYRPRTRDGASNARPEEIRVVAPNLGTAYDDRITLRGYVTPNKMMNCPLAKAVNLETDNPMTQVFSNFQFWWGWQYTSGGTNYTGADVRNPGMFKLGDAVVLGSDRFTVLAADAAFDRNGDDYVQSSHPDRLSLLANRPQEDEPNPPWGNFTSSFWTGNTTGTIDRNFGFADGSVRRYLGLIHTTGTKGSRAVGEDGQQVVKLPLRTDQSGVEYTYLPGS